MDEYEEDYYEEDYDEDLQELLEDYRKRRLMECLTGPIISTMFHVVLIVVLCIFVIDRVVSEEAEIEVMLIEEIVELIEEIPEEKIEEPEVIDESTVPELSFESLDITETNDAIEDVSEEIPSTDDDLFSDEVSEIIVTESAYVASITGGRTNAGKSKGRKQHGAERTRGPQDLSLKWLAEHQNADGSWGNQNKGGLTGLALLAFLADGDTPSSKRYGTTVKKGLKWIIEGMKNDTIHDSHDYGYAICTYALADAYSITGIYEIKEILEKCVDRIIKGQSPNGGFDYNYKHSDRNDISFGGWNIQALKSAYIAGIQHPDLEKSLENCAKGIKLLYKDKGDYEGIFAYTSGHGSSLSTTSVGTLCLYLLGDKNKEFKGGYNTITSLGIENLQWKGNAWSLYEWYYATQVVFFEGGQNWKDWNRKFQTMLLKNQFKDGHWESPSNRESGGRHLSGINGKVYSTALCSLMLAVYYRNLPSISSFSKKKTEEVETEEEEVNLFE